MAAPSPARSAASTLADDSPAAPRSCTPATPSSRAASRHASISDFSMKGLPTCTAGRRSFLSSKEREARPDAPWMPSRPVSAPTSKSRFPGAPAVALTTPSLGTMPTHIAFTRGLFE